MQPQETKSLCIWLSKKIVVVEIFLFANVFSDNLLFTNSCFVDSHRVVNVLSM